MSGSERRKGAVAERDAAKRLGEITGALWRRNIQANYTVPQGGVDLVADNPTLPKVQVKDDKVYADALKWLNGRAPIVEEGIVWMVKFRRRGWLVVGFEIDLLRLQLLDEAWLRPDGLGLVLLPL